MTTLINKILFVIGMVGLIIVGLLSFDAVKKVVADINEELNKGQKK